ncbi:hypothetical protein EV127DRAFT_352988 [Xylaria flabelliformis]|nr:hypothetical protein EV127DRAFT_352988 [Xylaria flabelliformis]
MISRLSNNKHRVTKRAPLAKTKSRSKLNAGSADQVETDTLLSIKSVYLTNIISRKKNHEYRKYRLHGGVERLWRYETADKGGKSAITKWTMGSAPMGWRYVGSGLWADRWGENSDGNDKVKKVF